MATTELMQEMRKAMRDSLDGAIDEAATASAVKKAREIADEMVSSVQYQLQDDLVDHLSYHVAEMAGRAVEALLEGNAAEMQRWLGCDRRGYTGRGDGFQSGGRDDRHPVIHGKLFETGCIALRKKIVAAHRDLIENERILDLEDQVANLVKQVNKANAEKEAMWQRVRDLSRSFASIEERP